MPRTAKPYRLIPVDIPARAARAGGLYAEIVHDFVSSGLDSALVELPGRKANSLNVGLRKAVTQSNAAARVVVRGGQVYLQKT